MLICLSLNLSSTYLNTIDVLPTAPSPNNTILKLNISDDEEEIIIYTLKTARVAISQKRYCQTISQRKSKLKQQRNIRMLIKT